MLGRATTRDSMKVLIVNADDFGYTSGVNRWIISAHTEGIVTSTSVMVCGRAAKEAKDLFRFPQLSVGLHFQIIDRTLEEGLRKRQQVSSQKLQEVEKEFHTQLKEFEKITGSKPTHIDSHHYVHGHPQVNDLFTRYYAAFSTPFRNMKNVKLITDFQGMKISKESSRGSVSVTGLLHILSKLDNGVSELMCHPGFVDSELRTISRYAWQREKELRTLIDRRISGFMHRSAIRLVNWRDVLVSP